VRLRDPVFISDLHLCLQRPAALARFFALVDDIAGRAAELLILGDLFEYWAGDDTLGHDGANRAGADPDDELAQAVVAALARLGGRGTQVFVMRGNRDVLLGQRFLHDSGATLLADPALADIDGAAPTLLSHGDAYCTLDVAYQAFRRQARDAGFQDKFLAQPLAQRRMLIGQARAASEAGKQQLDMHIMDVTPAAIDAAMRAAGVQRMVHGHTHRPARHEFALDGAPAVRWVLPDWEPDATPMRGGGLWLHDGELQAFAL